MTSAPFMQLYIADYLGDTLHLSTEQHGAYLLLLMAMWRAEGKLPNDASKLARIARVTPRRWHLIADEVMAFFDVEGEFITQKRLVEERKKASSISEKRSASGKLGAEAKALKNNDGAQANAQQMPKHSQKPDTRDRDTDVSLIEREFHETFWPIYPRKAGKPKALKAFIAARKRAALEAIIAGLRRYADERSGQDQQFTKWAEGWLNRDGWLDEPLAAQPRGSPEKTPTQADVFAFIARGAQNGPGQASEDRGGFQQAIPYLPAIRSGQG